MNDGDGGDDKDDDGDDKDDGGDDKGDGHCECDNHGDNACNDDTAMLQAASHPDNK